MRLNILFENNRQNGYVALVPETTLTDFITRVGAFRQNWILTENGSLINLDHASIIIELPSPVTADVGEVS